MKPIGKTFLSFALLLLINRSHAQTDTTTAPDKKAIDACIQKFYRVLSYQNNKPGKVDSLPDLFETDGTITAMFGQQPLLWTAPQFVAFIKNGAAQGMLERRETEIWAHTDLFGNIAQRISSYDLKVTVGVKPEERRGINSIQLVKINGAWLIHSLVWDRERESLKLPKAYGGQ